MMKLCLLDLQAEAEKMKFFAATRNGIAIKFSEKDVRSMGTSAVGVRGITLRDKDKVIGAAIINSEMDDDKMRFLTITEEGYGKRTKTF